MRRRSLLGGLLTGLSTLGAGFPARAETPLRYIPTVPLTTLDPVVTADPATRDHAFMVWDTLYGLDAAGAPQPQMCERHDLAPDNLTWRFTLRQGLRFHDGAPVRSADCVASLLRWMQRDGNGSLLAARLAELAIEGDRVFRLRLARPVPRLLHILASPVGRVAFIMPERLARTDADNVIAEPIGSGPFRFDPDAFQPGRTAAWTRFDDYVPRDEPASLTAGGKRAMVERVEWHAIADPALATSLLQTGQADWWAAPIADLLPVLAASRHVALHDLAPAGVLAALRLDPVPPFDDPARRRALLAAIDQRSFVQAATGGRGAMTGVGIFPPGSPFAAAAGPPQLPPPFHPPEDATPVHLLLAPGQPTLDALAIVGGRLMSAGGLVVQPAASAPTARCEIVEAAACEDPGSHPALRDAVSPLDRLREAWFDAPNPHTLAATLQRAVLDQATFLPLGAWRQPVATRESLTGLLSAGFPIFWNVRRDS